MKKLFLFLGFIFVGVSSFSQLNYSDGTVMSKPVGVTIGAPTDMKSWFYTGSPSFQWRPYASTAEVLSNLNNATKRAGNVLYYVSVGGTVVPYWFRDGYTDGNLEPFFQDFYDSTAALRTHFSNASNLTSGTISPSILPGKIVWDSLSYSDPAWITALSWSKILSAPSFALQQSLIDSIQVLRDSLDRINEAINTWDTVFVSGGLTVYHNNITGRDSIAIDQYPTNPTASTYAGFNSGGTWGFHALPSGNVSSVFSRSGDVTAQANDYATYYPQLSGSYSNPSWITALAWSKITKTGSSLADLATRSAGDLNSGTLPDARLSANITQNSSTQTLSNKTLTSPKINVGSDQENDIYYRDGSGNLARLPIGPEGSVLTVVSGALAWAIPNTPTIGLSTSSLSSFSAEEGTPSSDQTFTVSGFNLTDDITITLTTADGFEISEDGDSWQTTPIVLSEAGDTITGQPITIYVRLSNSASVGSREGLITATSTGASDKTVALTGNVSEEPVPNIEVSPSSLSEFTTEEGTPSSSQSFNVSGTDLEDDITVTAPSGYEVSLSSGSGYASSVEVEHSAGTVSSTPIYVRISSAATEGSPSGNVACTSTSASTKNVAVSGTVTTPSGPTFTRILIDLGANGVPGSNGPSGAVDGVRTPSNAAGTTGQAGDGRWWNNREDFRAGVWISNPVDTANNTITGFSISSDKNPSEGYGNDYSVNTGGSNTAVGDYPATAVRDNCYWHTFPGITTLTFTIPTGKKATVKFWGNRADATTRNLQFRLSGAGTWTHQYNAANNTNYNTAAVFTNITGTTNIETQVAAGSTFGHLSVIDIILEDDD